MATPGAEGHKLDRKIKKKVPKVTVGRRMSQEEEKRLLAAFKFGLTLDHGIAPSSGFQT